MPRKVSMLCFLLCSLSLCGTTLAIPDPSYVFCFEMGYIVEGENCVFPDGNSCERWAFVSGECGEAYVHPVPCAEAGERRGVARVCCDDLVELENTVLVGQVCVPFTGFPLCSACGDGTCDDWENSCNCPDDCTSDDDEDCLNNCDDGFACTDDRCLAGVCAHIPDHAYCGVDCGECFDGWCDPSDPGAYSTGCIYRDAPDGTPCASDGLFCNGEEQCEHGQCVIGRGPDPCLSPPSECCNEDTDACVPCCECGNDECEPECDEDCSTCPADCGCGECERCVGGTCRDLCGNGSCDSSCGENRATCPDDCEPCTSHQECEERNPDRPYCVNSTCVACRDDADCADDIYCNGQERCVDGNCLPGSSPCVGLGNVPCDEAEDDCCIDCTDDDDCANDEACNDDGCCIGGGVGPRCTPENPFCEQDPLFCNGEEVCNTATGECESAGSPCGTGERCNEEQDCCEVYVPALCGRGSWVCVMIGAFAWLGMRLHSRTARRTRRF